MRKFFLLAVMAVCAITASAQIEKGLRMGMTVNGLSSTYSDVTGASSGVGFGAGYAVEYNFNENLYLGTGIQYDFRGAKFKSVEYMGQQLPLVEETNVASQHIMVPVNIGGRVALADNTYIFGQAGPYASLATKKGYIAVGAKELKSESFDWGFNAKAGIEFSKFQIYGGYEYGMAEIWKKDGKNRSIVFGAAYMF